jgi:hypothetical protein
VGGEKVTPRARLPAREDESGDEDGTEIGNDDECVDSGSVVGIVITYSIT